MFRKLRPGDRIVIAAEAQEATKLEHRIGHLAADLVDHDPLDGPNMLALGIIDSRAFHFVAADEASRFPRFCCHGIPPHYCTVTTLESNPQDINAVSKGPRPHGA